MQLKKIRVYLVIKMSLHLKFSSRDINFSDFNWRLLHSSLKCVRDLLSGTDLMALVLQIRSMHQDLFEIENLARMQVRVQSLAIRVFHKFLLYRSHEEKREKTCRILLARFAYSYPDYDIPLTATLRQNVTRVPVHFHSHYMYISHFSQ